MCSSLIGSSPPSTASISVEIALGQALHGAAHALLRQAAHLEQPRLEDVQLFLEVPNDAFHRPRIS